jgi:mannitol-1-phosphate 5-dehydrogenase
MARTFVGIGFGPIQSGLFLLEAFASGNFERLVVAEVSPQIVRAVSKNQGRIRVNVAMKDGIATHEVAGIEIYNPLDAGDAARLVDAIAAADEIATALPSVEFFHRGDPSPAELLVRGIRCKLADNSLPRSVVYTAENHNHAAEILRDIVTEAIGEVDRPDFSERVDFVNTVIGKMSGVVADEMQIARDGLVPIVDGRDHAILVEQFNAILIDQIDLPDFRRGIDVFQEKLNLLPFEEAKLYGHNAAHAMLGYLANREQIEFIHEAGAELLELVRRAFLDESGGALCRRHTGIDPLFTQDGWAAYVGDLMDRMTNPYLRDRVDRVIRDPRRKLAWSDRLIGTMRMAIEHDIEPRGFAMGAAAAIELLRGDQPQEDMPSLLTDLWTVDNVTGCDCNSVIDHVLRARQHLRGTNNISEDICRTQIA